MGEGRRSAVLRVWNVTVRPAPGALRGPEPLGGEMPTPEQVEAFLSQPLYRDA